ncbi:unnamed protein product [Meganyctiphanes norvegica]|uniref:C2H2-type domain-containing protein n=1 Tax=Meganyctiphanes norvegica TaxID=48144 RepID=A0AAV2Q898_MEGNR
MKLIVGYVYVIKKKLNIGDDTLYLLVAQSVILSTVCYILGEKPYMGSRCIRAFTQKGDLRWHTRIHTDEKPYQCSQCNKAFRDKSNLTNRLRIQTGEKSYVCSQYDKAFVRNDNLEKHLRMDHTGEKPYQCI